MASSSPTVLVRVDAGLAMGFGHLTRCLALVQALSERGVAVHVATRADSAGLHERIRANGAEVQQLSPLPDSEPADGPVWAAAVQRADATESVNAEARWDAVVVDHYRLDSEWERVARENTSRIVAIDDLANRQHSVDFLVDHNWYGPGTANRYDSLVDDNTSLLLGPRYAILQREYAEVRRERQPVVQPPRRVLVSFGGTDVSGQTLAVIGALREFPDLIVDVVVGSRRVLTSELEHAVASRPHTQLHVELPTLAPLLGLADLVIGAGGTATWERLCLGVPALVTTVSANQSGVTATFHRDGVSQWLGIAEDVTVQHYVDAIADYIRNPELRVPPAVDGFGAQRVGYAVVPPGTHPLAARTPDEYDDAAYATAGAAGIADGGGVRTWHERAADFAEDRRVVDRVKILEYGKTPVGVTEFKDGHRQVVVDPYVSNATIESKGK